MTLYRASCGIISWCVTEGPVRICAGAGHATATRPGCGRVAGPESWRQGAWRERTTCETRINWGQRHSHQEGPSGFSGGIPKFRRASIASRKYLGRAGHKSTSRPRTGSTDVEHCRSLPGPRCPGAAWLDPFRPMPLPPHGVVIEEIRVQFPPPPLNRNLLTDDSLRQQTTQSPVSPGLVRFVARRLPDRR